MRLKIISFTGKGAEQTVRLCKKLNVWEYECTGYTLTRLAGKHGLEELPENIVEWIGKLWGECAFVFVGAAGIAVRMISPWVKDKFTDSPVIVMDEKGQYVIPLLSGHVGGAVETARKIASCTGGVAVITTATDVQGRFAVDVFAKKNNLIITDRVLAKKISAAVLEGEKIGFYSEYPGELYFQDEKQKIPDEVVLCRKKEELSDFPYGIKVEQEDRRTSAENVLTLLPKNLIVGVGCRKGISCNKLEEGITEILEKKCLRKEQVQVIVSIELKKDEEGLIKLCDSWKVPYITYSREELLEIKEVSSHSSFVEKVTGVDNVCERAVKRYQEEHYSDRSDKRDTRAAMIQEKLCLDSMTVAIGCVW